MEVMIETCCGIDVHQKSIVCCILDGPLDTNKPKKLQKKFGTTTIALQNALTWLEENHVTHVFFESTGQYWVHSSISSPILTNSRSSQSSTHQECTWPKNRYERCRMDCPTGALWSDCTFLYPKFGSHAVTITDTSPAVL